MPKIVDKEQKRKDIALSCKNLFIKKGINDLTIAEVAKTAKIGKGTVYEYFENKDDIVFEIVNILMIEHNERKIEELKKTVSTKDKVKVFFKFFYDEKEKDLRGLFKESVSISLMNPDQNMIKNQTECQKNYYNWFESIIKEGIEKNEIKPISLKLAKGLFTLGKGVFIVASSTNAIDNVQKEIDDYIDALFELIEIKND